MQSLNSRTDFCLRGKETMIKEDRMRINIPNNLFHNRSGFVFIIIIGLAVMLSAGQVFGQLSVTPMKYELSVTPNKIVKNILEIQNFDVNQVQIADIIVGDLTQMQDGSWDVIDPNFDPEDPNLAGLDLTNYDLSKLSSCRDWVSVTPSTVTIDPGQGTQVVIDVAVPRRTKGFFGAGLLVIFRSRPELGSAPTAPVTIRFLVPILVQVQGRITRHDIQLEDVGMELVPATTIRPSSTLISMDIKNDGGTYSYLKPLARVWNYTDEHWRMISTVEFSGASIIPGVNIKLRQGLQRSLPSGKYKIMGALYVDGKRSERIEKIIDFVGDESITDLKTDAPIDLVPGDISLDCTPGSTRLTSLKVYNASGETINIQTAIGIPPSLQGKTIQDLKGEDLDCTKWITINPQNFTLSRYGQQNITITSNMPDTAVAHPSYYSLLALWASYPDGQRAGVTTANICVMNPQVNVTPQIETLNISSSELSNSKYLFGAKFVNLSSVHITPIKCRAMVVSESGVPAAGGLLTSYEKGPLLPLEFRNYSGIIDFSNVEPGIYRVAASLIWGENPADLSQKQIQVRVSVEGEERVVEVLRTSIELTDVIEVQW
jgi:hypothetical protein